MSKPAEVGDTVYIVGKISHTHKGARPVVRVVCVSGEFEDSFLIYVDQIAIIETEDEAP